MFHISKTRAGFTLIELLVVLAIIASIVGLVSWSVYAVLEENQLEGAFDDLSLEIKAAQAEAVLTGQELVMEYDLDRNHLALQLPLEVTIKDYLDYDRESRRKIYQNKKRKMIREFTLDESIDFKSIYIDGKTQSLGQTLVFFNPDGTAEPHRLLILIPETGTSVALELRGLIGEVREIDPKFFEKKWDEDFRGETPLVVDDEDFFSEGYPDKMPSETKENF